MKENVRQIAILVLRAVDEIVISGRLFPKFRVMTSSQNIETIYDIMT